MQSQSITLNSINELYQHIENNNLINLAHNNLILIGGCSRSGKSTTTEGLSKLFTINDIKNLVINLDNWLITIEKRRENSTVLERYDCRPISESVLRLIKGEKIFPPVYDSVTRKRVAEQSEKPLSIDKGVILVEGVVALAIQDLHDVAALKIYVKTNDQMRLKRIEELYLDKGFTLEETNKIISARETEEVPFVKRTVNFANISLDLSIMNSS